MLNENTIYSLQKHVDMFLLLLLNAVKCMSFMICSG